MNTTLIIISVAVVSAILMYGLFKNAEEIKEEEPKFQPRKMTYTNDISLASPKKKKKKYYNKKKKPVVVDTVVEKRPVGRPRKTVE